MKASYEMFESLIQIFDYINITKGHERVEKNTLKNTQRKMV